MFSVVWRRSVLSVGGVFSVVWRRRSGLKEEECSQWFEGGGVFPVV